MNSRLEKPTRHREKNDRDLVPFDRLTSEIVRAIFSFIPFKGCTWLHIKLTCKKWNDIGNRLDPCRSNALTRMISWNRNEGLILKLLEDDRVDHSADSNLTIALISANATLEIVKRLLEDPK